MYPFHKYIIRPPYTFLLYIILNFKIKTNIFIFEYEEGGMSIKEIYHG